MGAKAKKLKLQASKETAPSRRGSETPARWNRHPAAYAAASLAVLIPCFWHSRIQAGDLASHIYNSWLADLAHKGQAPGLAVAFQSTNVLFDLLLGMLFQAFGAAAAQRIAVSLAVLVFFWGAFAFVRAAAGRAWTAAPVIAALAYGWVFHMGFFNFYLSLGLCFWAMALAWGEPPRRMAAAIPLLALAYVAHGLPVAWTVAVLAYEWLRRALSPRARAYLLGASLGSLVLLRGFIMTRFQTRWYIEQAWKLSGADQLWVFGNKYILLAGALGAVGILVAIVRWRAHTPAGALVPVAILTAAGIFLIPTAIWIPGYQHQLAFIAERMSLPLGIVLCALLAGAPLRAWQTGALAGVALIFFGYLYADEGALNDFEDQLDQAVLQIPSGQRVVLSVQDDAIQVNALTHMIDRACVQRCWSYANYEPSTAQFRVRLTGPSSIVVATDMDSGALQVGSYVVKATDLPLYQIVANNAGQLMLRNPPVGAQIGMTRWSGL